MLAGTSATARRRQLRDFALAATIQGKGLYKIYLKMKKEMRILQQPRAR